MTAPSDTPKPQHLQPSNRERLGALQGGDPAIEIPPKDPIVQPQLAQTDSPRIDLWHSKAFLIGSAIAVGVAAAGGLYAVVQLLGQDSGEAASAATGESGTQTPEPTIQPQPDLFSGPADLGAFIRSVTASTVVITCLPPESEFEDLGTGFPVDLAPLTASPSANVFLVTNQHVIEGCEGPGELSITAGRDTLTGSVISYDSELDLALVEPIIAGMPPLAMTPQASTGQWILAAGAPLGVANSASFGAITNVVKQDMLITFDAVIGPGNSGGPLVNSRGEVVGVVTAVWEEATGIGLAVPIEGLCVRLLDCAP